MAWARRSPSAGDGFAMIIGAELEVIVGIACAEDEERVFEALVWLYAEY